MTGYEERDFLGLFIGLMYTAVISCLYFYTSSISSTICICIIVIMYIYTIIIKLDITWWNMKDSENVSCMHLHSLVPRPLPYFQHWKCGRGLGTRLAHYSLETRDEILKTFTCITLSHLPQLYEVLHGVGGYHEVIGEEHVAEDGVEVD